MRVREAQVRLHIVPGNLPFRHFSKKPDLTPFPQRPRRFIANIPADKVIGEVEGVRVLHDFVAVADNAEDVSVRVAHVGLVALDNAATGIVDGFLTDCPIQSGETQGVGAGGGFGNFRTQTVPRFFTDIHHGFNFCGHFIFLLNLFSLTVSFGVIKCEQRAFHNGKLSVADACLILSLRLPLSFV